MNTKLDYLDKLKNNMGEEMAEMMSEEITKVMDEQRNMEQRYAQLITQRGQLKGISNKHKLRETKEQINVSLFFSSNGYEYFHWVPGILPTHSMLFDRY